MEKKCFPIKSCSCSFLLELCSKLDCPIFFFLLFRTLFFNTLTDKKYLFSEIMNGVYYIHGLRCKIFQTDHADYVFPNSKKNTKTSSCKWKRKCRSPCSYYDFSSHELLKKFSMNTRKRKFHQPTILIMIPCQSYTKMNQTAWKLTLSSGELPNCSHR